MFRYFLHFEPFPDPLVSDMDNELPEDFNGKVAMTLSAASGDLSIQGMATDRENWALESPTADILNMIPRIRSRCRMDVHAKLRIQYPLGVVCEVVGKEVYASHVRREADWPETANG